MLITLSVYSDYHGQCAPCVGARTALELVDGAVVSGLLEQTVPLFHLDHISHHGAYTVRIVTPAIHMLGLTPE